MKKCLKCGNEKLIEGVRYCLKCGHNVEKDKNTNANKSVNKDVNENVNQDGNCIVKTRLSVELFEIF